MSSGFSSRPPRTLAVDIIEPISAMLDGLCSEELRRLAVDIILLNAHYREEAESLRKQLEDVAQGNGCANVCIDLNHAYRLAMMRVHAFHHVVSTVTAALGYAPETLLPRAH